MKKRGCLLVGCIVWLIVVIVFFLASIGLIKLGLKTLFAEKEIHTEDYVVSANDTLWTIACENTDGNIGEYVYNLRKLNNIDNCIIYPGQVIKIIK